MDNFEAKELIDRFRNHLNDFANKEGITYIPSIIRFSEKEFSGTIKFSFEKNYDEFMKNEFENNCTFYGLNKYDLGRNFYIKEDAYEIYGINIRAKKYPILAKNLKNNKIYKFNNEVVKRSLEK
jgi:hypothetical protein